MLKRNFQSQTENQKHITVEDAFVLVNAVCTETKDTIRDFVRNELGWEIWKNPRLAAPVARELFQLRELASAPLEIIHGTLLIVIKNGLGKVAQDMTLLKTVHIACFGGDMESRNVASWSIIKNLEEAQAQTAPYTYAVEQPLHSAV